jgi:hypothetical protein
MVRVMPPPETVMVAVRWAVEVLAVAVAVNDVLPLPLVIEVVSQSASSVIVHDWLDVIVNADEAPPAAVKA